MMHDRVETETGASGGTTRRAMLSAAAGGFALAASGLFLPDWMEEAEAREGAYGGQLGGRHGKDQRGLNHAKRRKRARRRGHGDKKDKGRDKNDSPPRGTVTRDIAFSIQNQRSTSVRLRVLQIDRDQRAFVVKWDWENIDPNSTKDYRGSENVVIAEFFPEFNVNGVNSRRVMQGYNPPWFFPSVSLGWVPRDWDGNSNPSFEQEISFQEETGQTVTRDDMKFEVFRLNDSTDHIEFRVTLR